MLDPLDRRKLCQDRVRRTFPRTVTPRVRPGHSWWSPTESGFLRRPPTALFSSKSQNFVGVSGTTSSPTDKNERKKRRMHGKTKSPDRDVRSTSTERTRPSTCAFDTNAGCAVGARRRPTHKESSVALECPAPLPMLVSNFQGHNAVREMSSMVPGFRDLRPTPGQSSQELRTRMKSESTREERLSTGTIVSKLTQQLEASLREANQSGVLLENLSPKNYSFDTYPPPYRPTPQIHIPEKPPKKSFLDLPPTKSEVAVLSCESLPKPLHVRSPIPCPKSTLPSLLERAPPSMLGGETHDSAFVMTVG